MYNYNTPPGFNRPPGYGGPPMAPPPGMGGLGSAPGTGVPPGVTPPPGVNFNPPALGGPRPLPHNWQTPTNMPNINLNAPVIRLGTQSSGRGGPGDGSANRRDGGGRSGRPGLGMDSSMRDGDQGQKGRETTMLIPPTREEIARTIWVGNIPEGVNDEAMERILKSAGSLRRWTRAIDANDTAQTFGFAEYDDAQSLETAAEIFTNVRVPTKRVKPEEVKMEDGVDVNVDETKLQIVVDGASVKYAEEWSRTRKEDEATVQFRYDQARQELAQVVASLFNPPNVSQAAGGGDTAMQDAPNPNDNGVEVAVIPLSAAEDELSDIPEYMRETVAAEIATFRDKSIRRDQEQRRREEELEGDERRRNIKLSRASPPASAPIGPGGANGVPLGPKADRGIQGAPSGPKGSQFPRDYQGGVSFVNGGAINNGVYTKYEDEDSASDEEIERRRKAKVDARDEEEYKSELARWLKHESRNAASLERTSGRLKNEEAQLQVEREAQATLLKNFDDDVEAASRRHAYYNDHSGFMRQREKTRDREAKDDTAERIQEQRELAAKQRQKDIARGQADAFLDEQAEELLQREVPNEPQHFKISLGAAAKKLEQATAPRRTVADVESLLEGDDTSDLPTNKKRSLIPINFDTSMRTNLTPEEAKAAQKQLVEEIPHDKDGLWKWNVSWDHLLNKHIDVDIKNWAADKILDTLGVHEDMLVDEIVDSLKNRKGPAALVEELANALDEDAEPLVKKLWKLVIYYSEVEKRGIE